VMIKTVLWDLDGTLVDSAPTIIDALNKAFEQSGVEPTIPIHEELIGPPLETLMVQLAPHIDGAGRQNIIENFKEIYDNESYKSTQAYPQVSDTLLHLQKLGVRQWVCTNKRLAPTQKIVQLLRWENYFESLYALPDYLGSQAQYVHKSDMVNELIQLTGLEPNQMLMVGDTSTDQEVARRNGLFFAFASWGYGNVECASNETRLSECQDLWTFFS